MKQKKTTRVDAFTWINVFILTFLSLMCLLPIINVLAISFSARGPVEAGRVVFWPVDFTTAAYEYVLKDSGFLDALMVSMLRVLVGPALNLLLCILCAYPLSKTEAHFRARKLYVWIFLFATLFNGGLIPTYMVVKQTKLINSFWSLIIPGLISTFNVIILKNFFSSLPYELVEAASIDGATDFKSSPASSCR